MLNDSFHTNHIEDALHNVRGILNYYAHIIRIKQLTNTYLVRII